MGIFGHTIEGVDKEENEEGNHDAFSFLEEDGVRVFAVVDGRGSPSQSDAQVAASTAVGESMDSFISGCGVDVSIHRGIESARELLLSRDDTKRECCSVALAVVSNGFWRIGVVGNCFAVVTNTQGEHKIYIDNNKSMLTCENFDIKTFGGTEIVETIALSTDGLLRSTVTNGVPHKKFWSHISENTISGEIDVKETLECMSRMGKILDDSTLVTTSRYGLKNHTTGGDML